MTKIKIPVFNEITEEYEKELKEIDTKNLDPNGDRFSEKMSKENPPSRNPAYESFDKLDLPETFGDFIKLTNSSDEYWNDPIIINKNHITSFFGSPGTGRTIIFSGHGNQNWEVKEDLKTVIKLIGEK